MAARNARLQLKKLIILQLLKRRIQRRQLKHKKSIWVRRVLQERKEKSQFHLLVKDLRLFDHCYFFKLFRMTPKTYECLLSWVGPIIKKQETKMREPVSSSERLSLTLQFLSSGDSQSSIAASYRISPSVVSRTIHETCAAIWDTLREKGYLTPPSTKEDWKKVSKTFEERWNSPPPHALGAIDGKHVVMQCPARGGSDYFNYKKTHSIVLLGVCNGSYEFIMVDIGDAGRQSDGSVYSNSNLGFAIENNTLDFPGPERIKNSTEVFPYVFLGDDAFSLKTYLMKPYSGQNLNEEERIFNYRLSRGRRIIENTIGIAASRFRIFRRPIIAKVSTVKQITKAVVALHNFLMATRSVEDACNYCPFNYVDQEHSNGMQAGQWRQEIESGGILQINHIGSNNYSKNAKETRNLFKTYFNSEKGSIPWQADMIRRTSNHYDENLRA